MKSSNYAVKDRGLDIRRWCRTIHRHLSFFFSGMILVYALSGVFMNHRSSINPSQIITRQTLHLNPSELSEEGYMTLERVKALLEPLGESSNCTKYYYPEVDEMKVFLKGGSSLVVNIQTGKAVYEKIRPRPLIASMAKLHYNPGRWWTYFADAFAIGLILITVTGLFLQRKNKFLGRNGLEFLLGIMIPLLFLYL